jgi:hypothetical protein
MGLRKWAIVAVVALAIICAMTPATAWMGSERLVTIGDLTFGTEFVIQKPSATLFHTENIATADTEALAIAFPVDGSGQAVSPAIAQTAADTATASESSFFKANWCYTALVNPGGYDLTPNINTWHPMKSSSMVGSGIIWPYMNNAPDYGESTMQFKPAINTTPDTGNANVTSPIVGSGNGGLTGGNTSSGNATPKAGNASVTSPNIRAGNGGLTGGNTSSGNATPKTGNATPVTGSMKSKSTTPNRDYKNMTKTDIKNMTGLEKMYRNANLRNTVPQTHKGSVERPEAIAPLKHPMDVIKPPNKPQVISDARNMTKEGTDLKTLFWDL